MIYKERTSEYFKLFSHLGTQNTTSVLISFEMAAKNLRNDKMEGHAQVVRRQSNQGKKDGLMNNQDEMSS